MKKMTIGNKTFDVLTLEEHYERVGAEQYEQWKWGVGNYYSTEDTNRYMTEEDLVLWCLDPRKALVCLFCNTTLSIKSKYCPICMEYKGLQPLFWY